MNTSQGAPPRIQILAIPGSLRHGSVNRRLLQAAVAVAPADIAVSVYDSLADLPGFNEDIEAAAFESGPVKELRDRVLAADGLLIATPEYNHSIPGVLKNAIDWLSRPLARDALVDKLVAVIGATRGRWGTRLSQAALRQTLFSTESRILSRPVLYMAQADSAFNELGHLTDERIRKTLGEILAAMAQAGPRPAKATGSP